MPNAFLNKKWLNLSKTQFLTQNIIKPCKTYFLSQKDVKPNKTLFSTQNIEKSSFKQKRSFSTYSWYQTHFETRNGYILAKRRLWHKIVSNLVRRWFQEKILKNPFYNKKGLSQPTVDTKRIFQQEIVKF